MYFLVKVIIFKYNHCLSFGQKRRFMRTAYANAEI